MFYAAIIKSTSCFQYAVAVKRVPHTTENLFVGITSPGKQGKKAKPKFHAILFCPEIEIS